MKIAAFLLITFSLCLGVVGALSAYLPPLTLADGELIGLTLNGPAGNTSEDVRVAAPIAGKGAEVTAELLTTLRADGVERIRVKEFAFARWPEWWMFVVGCVGLGLGAVVVRASSRRAVADASTGAESAGGRTRLSPEHTLDAIRAELEALRARLVTIGSEPDRLEAILVEVGRMQKTHVESFLAARGALTARLGLGGYARVMDAFAAGERAINRAWSAAADEVEAEARVCIDNAIELFVEARARV